MDRSRLINIDDDLSIPMRSVGTKVVFHSRIPTSHKLEHSAHVTMTSPTLWNSSEVVFAQHTDRGGVLGPWKRNISCVCGVTRSENIDSTDDDALLNEIDPSIARLGEQLLKRHRVSQADADVYEHTEVPSRRTFVSDERGHTNVSAELIAGRFSIGPLRAQKTLRATTQRGIRSAILPISRRNRADQVVWCEETY